MVSPLNCWNSFSTTAHVFPHLLKHISHGCSPKCSWGNVPPACGSPQRLRTRRSKIPSLSRWPRQALEASPLPVSPFPFTAALAWLTFTCWQPRGSSELACAIVTLKQHIFLNNVHNLVGNVTLKNSVCNFILKQNQTSFSLFLAPPLSMFSLSSLDWHLEPYSHCVHLVLRTELCPVPPPTPPPNSYAGALTPNATIFGDRVFRG